MPAVCFAAGVATVGVAGCRVRPEGRTTPPADLAITHAAVLDVRTGRVLPDATVLVRGGMITAVLPASARPPRAARVLHARGRVLTPGLVDTHLHTHLVFNDPAPDGGTTIRALLMRPDSIAAYRRVLGRTYLPHGVTAVRDVGTDERYAPMLAAWARRSPEAPDVFPSGAYLVSAEPGRAPVSFGVAVGDSATAAAKVREYHALGFRSVKLYWRLREPEFRGALAEARRLGISVTGHVDQGVMTIGRALELGLRHVEHVHTFAASVMPDSEVAAVDRDLPRVVGEISARTPGVFDLVLAAYWRRLGPADARVEALIARLQAADGGLTPTLHVFAQRLGLAHFESRPWGPGESTAGFTAVQRRHTVEGYRIMASYVRRMHDAGVRLTVGTDAQDPGRAVLSEMLLLHETGIPMADVFRIATLNGARAIDRDREFGTVEVGRRANFVLFDGDPLARPADLLGGKTVVKDGVIVAAAP